MQRLIRWLEVEMRGIRLIGITIGTAVAAIVLSKISLLILILTGFFPSPVPGAHALLNTGDAGLTAVLLGLTAISEEYIFRAPLYAIGNTCSRPVTLFAALGLSTSFGLLHGGLTHLPIQGALGLILSLVFLKCGGLQRNFYKAIAAASITHFLYNIGIVAIGRLPLH